MKTQVSKTQLYNTGCHVVSVDYCGLQHLLKCIEPFGYNSGVMGWNFDAYRINDFIICTGYRNLPKTLARDIDKYEQQAIKICNYYSFDTEKRDKKLHSLLIEFCNINRG